jgi:transposase
MTQKDREIQRRLRILKHAEETGHVGRPCRYFDIRRASFYHWKAALETHGEAGLVRKKPTPKNPKNRMPPEIVEKVLHQRKTYHLGPMRIVWNLARYHDIKISAAGVSRILKRNSLNRLPRGTRLRKVHTTRYQQQVPGHQILVDVKFLIFREKDGKLIKRCQYTASARLHRAAARTRRNCKQAIVSHSVWYKMSVRSKRVSSVGDVKSGLGQNSAKSGAICDRFNRTPRVGHDIDWYYWNDGAVSHRSSEPLLPYAPETDGCHCCHRLCRKHYFLLHLRWTWWGRGSICPCGT